MLATSKIKWFGSLILAGVLLTLALTGGKWGTTYSASASVNADPIITRIQPSGVLAGSPDVVVIITGSNFGTLLDTRVRLTGVGVDQLITPLSVIPTGISFQITADLLTVPTFYLVTVIVSDKGTIPTLPTIPPYDHESNPVLFNVYPPYFVCLPIVSENAVP